MKNKLIHNGATYYQCQIDGCENTSAYKLTLLNKSSKRYRDCKVHCCEEHILRAKLCLIREKEAWEPANCYTSDGCVDDVQNITVEKLLVTNEEEFIFTKRKRPAKLSI